MIKNLNKKPPGIAVWMLKQLLPDEEWETPAGDFEEYYSELANTGGIVKAWLWYWSQIAYLIPGRIINNIWWSTIMFRNYFKIALRNLNKNRYYAFINIFGLGIAVSSSILGYVNYDYQKKFDAFHVNAENIYRINSIINTSGGSYRSAMIPSALATSVLTDVAGVERAVRIGKSDGILKYGDTVFNETVFFADRDFFEMFTFPFQYGNKSYFRDENAVIISKKLAEKYFSNDNPIGKELTLILENNKKIEFTVNAVTAAVPDNSSIGFDILLPYKELQELNSFDDSSWDKWASVLFVQISENVPYAGIEDGIQRFVQVQRSLNPDREVQRFYLDPLLKIAENSENLRYDILKRGMPVSMLLGTIGGAVFALLLACFNFMNTAIAYSSRRLKEIGIRKVLGGIRRQLITQFMYENIILCVFALIAGILLAKYFLPFYNNLWPDISLTLSFWNNPGLLLFLVILVFVTGIAAGAYPAFFISSFNPVTILNGKQKFGKKSGFIRIMLISQFVFSMMGIILAVKFAQNADYQTSFDLGYNRENIIVVPVDDRNNLDIYRNAISNHPAIESISGTDHHVGFNWTIKDVRSGEINSEIRFLDVGEDYLETMGFELLDGQFFNRELESESDRTIIVTRKLLKEFGWETAIGESIIIDNVDYLISGVIEDFYFNGFWLEIEPFIIRRSSEESYRTLIVKYSFEDRLTVDTFLRETWKDLFPEQPYAGSDQDFVLFHSLLLSNSISTVTRFHGVTSILIACMGLFALVSLDIAKRTKEIGIRKILGANLSDIAKLVSRELMFVLIISSIFGAVSGYYLSNLLIQSIFAYHVGFSVLPYLLSASLIVSLAALTVGIIVFRAVQANPVDSLRYE